MFQTEVNHFLQSLDYQWLQLLMQYVSRLGYQPFYIAALLIIVFGVDAHKGIGLLQVLLGVAIVTTFLKELLALPRPLDVDNTLRFLGTNYNPPNILFAKRGAASFWEMLPDDVIAYYRVNRLSSFGFPSGHVSGAVAFFGGIALVFPLPYTRVLAGILCLLMAISRMYLGVHFLADVVGGLLIGILGLSILYIWQYKRHVVKNFVQESKYRLLLANVVWLLLPFMLWLLPYMNKELLITLFACNIFYLAFKWLGCPMPNGSFLRRAFAIIVACVSFIAFSLLTNKLLQMLNFVNENAQMITLRLAEFSVALVVALYANLQLGLMHPQKK
ncbi:MAG: phosphatase PAP2 family protein [Cytophagales bacterium]|nr:phosphatase PAP2 family protein [Bernardetiaceae bacterium]MDW8205243.1 phosphatase PAP2 family protein [Cytophagales bacterium]